MHPHPSVLARREKIHQFVSGLAAATGACRAGTYDKIPQATRSAKQLHCYRLTKAWITLTASQLSGMDACRRDKGLYTWLLHAEGNAMLCMWIHILKGQCEQGRCAGKPPCHAVGRHPKTLCLNDIEWPNKSHYCRFCRQLLTINTLVQHMAG